MNLTELAPSPSQTDTGLLFVGHTSLPIGLLGCTTAFTLLLIVLTLNSYFCCTTTISHQVLRRLSSKRERRVILVHYLIALPLFEIFVIWGPHFDSRVQESSAVVVVGWLHVLAVSVCATLLGCLSAYGHVFAMQFVQVLQFPMLLLFVSDRVLYHTFGVESICTFFMLLVIILEMYLRARPNMTIPVTQDIRIDDTEMVRTEHLRSYKSHGGAGNGRRVSMAFGMDEEPNYESGVDSEVMDEVRARQSASQLVEFMHSVMTLRPADLKDSKQREKLVKLQRQAEIYSTVVPLPALSASGRNEASTSANVDSQGLYHRSEEDDF